MSQPYQLSGGAHIQALWAAQGGDCALCGKRMYRQRFEAAHARLWAKYRATLDHIQPRSKGGTDTPDNFQLVHARCNKVKGNQTPG